MPDITMCTGDGCEARVTCYRFLAKPNEYRQSYFKATPDVNGGCEYYINHNRLNDWRKNILKGADLFVKNTGGVLKKLSNE